MRLRILTLPDNTWTVVIDRVAPDALERLANSKDAVKEATGARGVLVVAGDEAELPGVETSARDADVYNIYARATAEADTIARAAERRADRARVWW